MDDFIICPICKRNTPKEYQEAHHLIPRVLSKRNKYAKMPQNQKGNETITVCSDCGNQVHQLFTEKELAENFNTVVALVGNKDVQKWIGWVSKKPNDFGINMKTKKRRA